MCLQKRFKRDSNAGTFLDIELSDSQFLRNCNTVFTELSEKSIREKGMREKKPMEPIFLLIYSAVSRRTISGSLLIVEKK